MPTPDSRDRRKKRVITLGSTHSGHGRVPTAEERAMNKILAEQMSKAGGLPADMHSRALYLISGKERHKRISAIKKSVMKSYSNKPDGKCHEDDPCFQGSSKDSRARRSRGSKLRLGERT